MKIEIKLRKTTAKVNLQQRKQKFKIYREYKFIVQIFKPLIEFNN